MLKTRFLSTLTSSTGPAINRFFVSLPASSLLTKQDIAITLGIHAISIAGLTMGATETEILIKPIYNEEKRIKRICEELANHFSISISSKNDKPDDMLKITLPINSIPDFLAHQKTFEKAFKF